MNTNPWAQTKKFFVYVIVAIPPLLMFGCGEGGNVEVNIVEGVPTKTVVSLDASGLGVDIYNGNYKIIGNDDSITISDSGTTLPVAEVSDSLGVYSVVNDTGEPYMLAWKHPGDEEVTISMDSTAEMFFLMRPNFWGVKFTDTKEVSKRIRSHPNFPELKGKLADKINEGSVCPLDSMCSASITIFADNMYSDLDFTDLLE